MKSYPYKIYYPASYKTEKDKKWPLILFLHGAGERGNDLEMLKRQALPKKLEKEDDFPFVVAYPQCPSGSYWQVPQLNTFYDMALETPNIDTSRIYLTGISMGGYGTWIWAGHHPEKFAAIIPVCGGGDLTLAENLIDMPIWAFHGAKDDIVPMKESLRICQAIEAAGGKPELTIYPDLYHDSWTATYKNPEIYDWLLRHTSK